MHTSSFFRLFPPPKFMQMRHAGLDISDAAIRCIQYSPHLRGLSISRFDSAPLAPGIFSGGDIKDDKALAAALTAFDKKNDLSYVKVSLPEEKAYLFQIDVSGSDTRSIEQNIEFKLEENVPLSAADAVFYFDLMPLSVTGGVQRASVSVVPRSYVEHYIELLRTSGIFPVAFEVVPRAVARAIIPHHSETTHMIIHLMAAKTGIYVVSGGVVCFTSTVSPMGSEEEASVAKEINRVYSYWLSHSDNGAPIRSIILTGRGAAEYETMLQNVIAGAGIPVEMGNVWQNSLDLESYIPPIAKAESNEYVVAAGLSMFT